MRLTALARSAVQGETLARLEQRRLRRAQALRQSCAEAHAAAIQRVQAVAEALARHAAQRDRLLRTAYDGVAQRLVTAAMLHVVRGQEDQLRRTRDALAAEQDAAIAARDAAELALSLAQSALVEAIRRSAKRDRLATQLTSRWTGAKDDAEEASRANDVDDRAGQARAA